MVRECFVVCGDIEIVYEAYEPAWDHHELWIARADGTHAHRLWTGDHGMTAETPDWGP